MTKQGFTGFTLYLCHMYFFNATFNFNIAVLYRPKLKNATSPKKMKN